MARAEIGHDLQNMDRSMCHNQQPCTSAHTIQPKAGNSGALPGCLHNTHDTVLVRSHAHFSNKTYAEQSCCKHVRNSQTIKSETNASGKGRFMHPTEQSYAGVWVPVP